MTVTPAQLKATVASIIAQSGTVFNSNENESGRWLEFAEAAESLAGASTTANANINGYMKRAAIALEVSAGTSGAEESSNYFGYLKRIVDALEALGSPGTGSLGNRLVEGAASATWSIELQALTLSADTVAENSAQGTVIGNILGVSDGSTLTIASQERANWFDINGSNQLIVGTGGVDFEVDASATVTVRETNPDGSNSPNDTILTVTITNVAETLDLEYVGGKVAAVPGTTTDAVISLTDLAGGLAAAPAEGDIVIVGYAIISTAGDASYGVQTAGYTEVAELFSNDDVDANLSVSYKIMGATPDTSVTVSPTLNVGLAGAVAIHVWRGVDTATPLDVASTTATGINTDRPNAPSITPVTAGSVIIVVGGGAQNSLNVTLPFTQPAAQLSNFLSVGSPDSVSSAIGIGSFDWTSGAFDPVAWTGGENATDDSWAAVTLALRPGTS